MGRRHVQTNYVPESLTTPCPPNRITKDIPGTGPRDLLDASPVLKAFLFDLGLFYFALSLQVITCVLRVEDSGSSAIAYLFAHHQDGR